MKNFEFKERILQAVPLETYAGKFVALKKQGKYYKGLCPFHTEKTPSFVITPDRGIFHCFGCSKGGDLFTFVMEYEGVSFVDALDILARYSGLEKPTPRKRAQNDLYQRYEELNKKAMEQFSSYLFAAEGGNALNYLKSRGLKEETIRQFNLGASPDQWHWLEDRMAKNQKELLELGLLRRKEDGRGDCYDFFRGRVIFPIHNIYGKVVAFGARSISEKSDVAKYINSPENKIFKKSNIMYGLFQSLAHIRQQRECIIVEGYLDVIGMHQAGFSATIAPMGTAITMVHVKMIHRYVDKIILLMDGDKAGRAAALRCSRLILDNSGLKATVILLPPGIDPFDLANRYDKVQINKILQNQIAIENFLILETLIPDLINKLQTLQVNATDPEKFSETAMLEYARADITGKLTIAERRAAMFRLFDLLKSLSNAADQSIFLTEGAKILNIHPSDLQKEWIKIRSKKVKKVPEKSNIVESRVNTVENHPLDQREIKEDLQDQIYIERLTKCENELLTQFIFNPAIIAEFLSTMNQLEFSNQVSEIIWRHMESRFLTGDLWSAETFQKSDLPNEVLSLITELMIVRAERYVEVSDDSIPDTSEVIQELLYTHELIVIKQKIDELNRQLQVADVLERELFYPEYNDLIKNKRKLEKKLQEKKPNQVPD